MNCPHCHISYRHTHDPEDFSGAPFVGLVRNGEPYVPRLTSEETKQAIQTATALGPNDILVIRSVSWSADQVAEFNQSIREDLPSLVGRVLVIEAAEADVYVVPGSPCGYQNRDGSAPECAP